MTQNSLQHTIFSTLSKHIDYRMSLDVRIFKWTKNQIMVNLKISYIFFLLKNSIFPDQPLSKKETLVV